MKKEVSPDNQKLIDYLPHDAEEIAKEISKHADLQKEPTILGDLTARLEEQASTGIVSLEDPRLFINRELSWLKFNERVLEEACDRTHPLLERLKFFSIGGSNLDEFFMVRVSGLKKQLLKGVLYEPADGMKPYEQLAAIRQEVEKLFAKYSEYWTADLLPSLAEEGIFIKKFKDLGENQKIGMRSYFEQMIMPTLTPLAMDLAHPFPLISNLSVNLAIVLKDKDGKERYARLKIPSTLFQRLIEVPNACEEKTPAGHKIMRMVFLEDLIASNLDLLFPGMQVVAAYPFRVARDAEIEITFDEASDLLTAVEDGIETRKVGSPVRLEVDGSIPELLKDVFLKNLRLSTDAVYQFNGPLGFCDLMQLLGTDRPDLKDKPFLPYVHPDLSEEKNLFSAISKRDHLLYHPYDSFTTIINLLNQAAKDPDVLVIKIILYRIDKKSPIIDSLLEARHNGKSVLVILELRAKFDEANNISWARSLEHAGVHVIYGLVDYKVHVKACMIVRRESGKIVRYTHFSSGNYNAVTARIYGDIGCLTADPEIGSDVSDLFNALTGYSQEYDYKHLLVAPKKLKKGIIARIDREIESHKKEGGGYIAIKLNGLVDSEVIKTLYKASMAGVKIDLNVRGLCCLRPGIKGVSENIHVISIVGRFLEHARIYYFRNGGQEELLLGSSDLMPRNLKNRVEVLFPVRDELIRRTVIENMLKIHLSDTVKARLLLPGGNYEKIVPVSGEGMNSQEYLIKNRGVWHGKT